MGNPIQYRNTDNKGGFVKRLQYAPPRGVPRGGVNENLTPDILYSISRHIQLCG